MYVFKHFIFIIYYNNNIIINFMIIKIYNIIYKYYIIIYKYYIIINKQIVIKNLLTIYNMLYLGSD